MTGQKPFWFSEAKDVCRKAGVEIAGWGAENLVIEAGNVTAIRNVVMQLAQLGLRPIDDEEDREAGLLTLSLAPASSRLDCEGVTESAGDPAGAHLAVPSRRPLIDQLLPLLFAALAVGCGYASVAKHGDAKWRLVLLAAAMLLYSVWEGLRVWGWKLDPHGQDLRVRRYFRWTSIPWEQVRAVKVWSAGRNQQAVVLELLDGNKHRLGTFSMAFARILHTSLNGSLEKFVHVAGRRRRMVPSEHVESNS